MAAIRFATVSATYSVPFRPRPTPVGPMTSAAGSRCSAKPDPIRSDLRMNGSRPDGTIRSSRMTVPRCTILPLAATVPFSTLVTNRAATRPKSAEVMSQGPLMPWPVNVSRT